MPPITLQLEMPQLSVPPPGKGNDACADARDIALSSAMARTQRNTNASVLNLRHVMLAPKHPVRRAPPDAIAVMDSFASHNCRKARARGFQPWAAPAGKSESPHRRGRNETRRG